MQTARSWSEMATRMPGPQAGPSTTRKRVEPAPATEESPGLPVQGTLRTPAERLVPNVSGEGLDSTEHDAAGREQAAARRVVIAARTTSPDPSSFWWAHRSAVTLARTTPRLTTSPRTSTDSTERGGNRL